MLRSLTINLSSFIIAQSVSAPVIMPVISWRRCWLLWLKTEVILRIVILLMLVIELVIRRREYLLWRLLMRLCMTLTPGHKLSQTLVTQ